MRLIETQGMTVQLGGQKVLHHINFHIDKGEIVTIVGPNGSGKSTLLRSLIGAIQGEGQIIHAPGLKTG